MIRQQWVNIDDEGALHALLRRLAVALPVTAIDTLWLLPTRRATGVESTVAILAVFDPDHPDRRRVGAIRWLVTRDRKGAATVSEEMHEYALAPVDAIARVVEGVVRRLGDDNAEPPQPEPVEGDAERWNELLRRLGAPAETGANPTVDENDETLENAAEVGAADPA